MTDFHKIEEHLLHMHAGLLSLAETISDRIQDYPDGHASGNATILKLRLRLTAERVEEMALQAATLHSLARIGKRTPEVADK